MEALASTNALEEVMAEGGGGSFKRLPKTSLPHRQKRHIFEGIDTSFIARDILGTVMYRRCTPIELQSPIERQELCSPILTVEQASPLPAVTKTAMFRPSEQYRSFIKRDQDQNNKLGRSKATKCRDIPTCYNSFYATYIQEGRGINRITPTAGPEVIRSSIQPIKPINLPPCDVRYQTVHIGNVNRVMGRQGKAEKPSPSPSQEGQLKISRYSKNVGCNNRGPRRPGTGWQRPNGVVSGLGGPCRVSKTQPIPIIRVSRSQPRVNGPVVRVTKVQPSLPVIRALPQR
eukprot:sb/3479374/